MKSLTVGYKHNAKDDIHDRKDNEGDAFKMPIACPQQLQSYIHGKHDGHRPRQPIENGNGKYGIYYQGHLFLWCERHCSLHNNKRHNIGKQQTLVAHHTPQYQRRHETEYIGRHTCAFSFVGTHQQPRELLCADHQ